MAGEGEFTKLTSSEYPNQGKGNGKRQVYDFKRANRYDASCEFEPFKILHLSEKNS